MMIAEAVNNIKHGPYKDFFMDEDQLYELELAALLHDCGKVATPIHIVDKSTKLERVMDRIELVETRIEASIAQTKVAFYENLIKNNEDKFNDDELQKNRESLNEKLKVLQEDREFLLKANQGNVTHEQEDESRLDLIQKKKWKSYTGKEENLLTDDEVYNFKVERGTLNTEEREIINHHVVTTIEMLRYLPFPKVLSGVPEIAGAHHERIDGKGYPNGTKGYELSPQSKILALADVFEALTAADRPYKVPLPLSTVSKIIENMIDEGHLDKDLTELFLEQGIHIDYAKKFLDESQIDIKK